MLPFGTEKIEAESERLRGSAMGGSSIAFSSMAATVVFSSWRFDTLYYKHDVSINASQSSIEQSFGFTFTDLTRPGFTNGLKKGLVEC